MEVHGVLQELAILPAPDRSRDSIVQEWADCLRNVRASAQPARAHAHPRVHVQFVSFRQVIDLISRRSTSWRLVSMLVFESARARLARRPPVRRPCRRGHSYPSPC